MKIERRAVNNLKSGWCSPFLAPRMAAQGEIYLQITGSLHRLLPYSPPRSFHCEPVTMASDKSATPVRLGRPFRRVCGNPGPVAPVRGLRMLLSGRHPLRQRVLRGGLRNLRGGRMRGTRPRWRKQARLRGMGPPWCGCRHQGGEGAYAKNSSKSLHPQPKCEKQTVGESVGTVK